MKGCGKNRVQWHLAPPPPLNTPLVSNEGLEKRLATTKYVWKLFSSKVQCYFLHKLPFYKLPPPPKLHTHTHLTRNMQRLPNWGFISPTRVAKLVLCEWYNSLIIMLPVTKLELHRLQLSLFLWTLCLLYAYALGMLPTFCLCSISLASKFDTLN